MNDARPIESRVPADQGLSTLGLIMQLFGTLFGVLALIAVILFAFPDVDRKTLMLVGFALSGVRSLFHARAGAQLTHGHKSLDGKISHLAGIRRYILVAVAHTIAMVAIDIFGFGAPLRLAVAVGVGLLVWPAALAVMLSLPRLSRFDGALPLAEDKGFEGLAILMSIMGACGAIEWGALLVVALLTLRDTIGDFYGVLFLIAVAALFARSYLHVTAGLAGVRETNFARSVRTGNRYAIVGIAVSAIVAGILFLVSALENIHFVAYPLVACLGWLLLAWPLIVSRVVGERQLASLADNDVHYRAPDAGLTGLGWLLIANAMMTLSVLLPDLLAGPETTGINASLLHVLERLTLVSPSSIAWNVGIVAVELWAGIELVRMGSRFRLAATLYAIVAGAWTAYHSWPQMRSFEAMRHLEPEEILAYVPLATNLVLPIATFLLVRRRTAPTAQARYRPTPS
ncbi:hypothetical protein BH11MYX2_BH11MYX2_04950 [soil metagenome]